MILRDGRIEAAGCVLPLSKNQNLSKDLGTRHRAGLGVSEESDAIAVIVSEERGDISVALGGALKRHVSTGELATELSKALIREKHSNEKTGIWAGIKGFFKPAEHNGEDEHEDEAE